VAHCRLVGVWSVRVAKRSYNQSASFRSTKGTGVQSNRPVKNIRFSLQSLLLLAAAIALLVGLSQARRRSILQEANLLKVEGANFAIDYRWWEKVWVQKPPEAGIVVQQSADGRLAIRNKVYPRDEAIAMCKSLTQRLADFGVNKVVYIVQRTTKSGASYLVVVASPDQLPLRAD
jgi:hypothetical protein